MMSKGIKKSTTTYKAKVLLNFGYSLNNSIIIKWICFIVFFSCTIPKKHAQNTTKINLADEVSFSLGSIPYMGGSGIFYEEKSNQDLFYFSDVNYGNWLKFYTLNGEEYKTVDLSGIVNELIRIQSINIISIDSYIAVGTDGKCFVINQNGEIQSDFNIGNSLKDHLQGNTYLYKHANVHKLDSRDKLYVTPIWYESELVSYDSVNSLMRSDFYSYLKFKSTKIQESPLAFEIDIKEPNKNRPIYASFNKDLVGDNEFIPSSHLNHCMYSGNYLYAASKYSNNIFKYDLVNGKTSRANLSSEGFTLANPPIDISNNSEDLDIKSIYKDYARGFIKKGGYIVRILYDRNKELYYVLLKHPFKEVQGKNVEKDWSFSEKSIIILDKNLKQIEEIKISDPSHNTLAWVCSKGIVFSNQNPSERGYDPKTFKIAIYSINK